jgi:hypothetical protein
MTNFYDYVRSHPEQLRQFCCREILFLRLDCPPDFVKDENWNDYNIFMHVLTGGKRMSSREKSWVLDEGSTVFVKKGGVTVERIGPEPFCVSGLCGSISRWLYADSHSFDPREPVKQKTITNTGRISCFS